MGTARTHPARADGRYVGRRTVERWRPGLERIDLNELWAVRRPIVGMVHLLPLPGSPRWGGSMEAVMERAVADAEALVGGGVDGVLVENYGDVPFSGGPAGPAVVAAMSRVVARLTGGLDVAVGVNVLRNDAVAAVSIAAATGASFVRVNVHVGGLLTDQGWMDGRAHETLRERARLGVRCAILADVAVKHSVLPPGYDVGQAARDTWHRGLADGLIVTGVSTGLEPDPERLRVVREAVPQAPVWLGSGVTPANAARLVPGSSGVIAGSALQRGGVAGAGVDGGRVRAFVEAVRPIG